MTARAISRVPIKAYTCCEALLIVDLIIVLVKSGLPAAFKSSMLQSMEKGQMTEIDFINGSIVRYGERVKIATPVNRTLVACMKGVEYWISHFGRISSDPTA